jgi:hypothetical protein
MESPKEFTTRALRIQSAAIDLSRSISGDNFRAEQMDGNCQTEGDDVGRGVVILN